MYIELPQGTKVIGMKPLATSQWAKTFQIQTSSPPSYFLKISTGHHGHEALKGEHESATAIHKTIPDFIPQPLGWGTFQEIPDTHFYLCEFHNLLPGPPAINSFTAKLARLHTSTSSPNGKFGFHVTTYNGNLPQENTYTDTWEAFFTKGLKHILDLHARVAGASELDNLAPAIFSKVIPRLLRPLESHGRTIKPTLVHGDLWCGNTATDSGSEKAMVFDPCCCWAHNEYEMGDWRQTRNRFSEEYFAAYHAIIPPSHPQDEFDDRNALYAIVISEMKRLID
ncbi:hypothetical protein HYFRA_00004714, partial [Hymenoscyphus fraxineus]